MSAVVLVVDVWGRKPKAVEAPVKAPVTLARLESVVDRLNGALGQLEALKQTLIAEQYAPPKQSEGRDDG